MESRYANNWQDTSDSVVGSENSEHLQKVLDDNVEQISSVRNQLRAQSFTSLMADLCQDINRVY